MAGLSVIRRSAVAMAGVGLAFGALTACTSEQALPKVDFPSASAVAPIVGQQPVSAAPTYTGYAPPFNAITVQIVGVAATAKLSYPMAWLTFTVTITNTSGFAFQGIDPLLVFGQCTCSPANYHIAPGAALQLWTTGTGTGTGVWKSIQPSDLDSKQTFKYTGQVGSINLGPKAVVTYKYRMELGRTVLKAIGLVNGTGSLNMYILQLPKHTRLSTGLGPEASVPLTYAFG